MGRQSDDWYQGLFRAAASDGLVTGEITPGYSILSQSTIAKLKALNPRIKILFIMRNPVDRIWSQAVRMLGLRMGRAALDIPEGQLVDYFDYDILRRKTDYRAIVGNWRAFIDEPQMHIGFYDPICESPASFFRYVLSFLEVDANRADQIVTAGRLGAAAAGIPIPSRLERMLYERYEKQIAALAEHYGSYALQWRARCKSVLTGVPQRARSIARREPKVLLVVGAAHGGTTIAAMLLAQHPEVFSAGELTDFPNGEQFAADNVCSCGVAAHSCGFWRSVRDASGAEVGDRPAEIREVYTQIARLSDCRAIVDVSHGTSRARCLGSMDGLDLRVLKVVRPVEAVVDSQIRRAKERRHSSQTLFSRLVIACRAAFAWGMIENTVKPNMLDCPVIEVDYDRLCADPAGELARIGDEIGIDYTCVARKLAPGTKGLVRPSHMVRGNRKLRGSESIVLKRDDSYRTNIKRPERVAAKVIGGAPAVLYRVLNAGWRVSQQFGKRTLRRQAADAPGGRAKREQQPIPPLKP